MRSGLRFLLLSAACFVSGGATLRAAVLAIDFDESDVAAPTLVTAAGFQSFAIDNANAVVTTSVTRTYGAFSVTLALNNATFGFDDRLRAAPVNSGAFTDSDLLRDVIFSRATGAGITDGLDITIAGLTASTPYTFTIWSYDASSAGTRVSDWSANGSLAVSNYTFNGSVAPTTNSQYKFSFNATTNALGQMVIAGRRDDTSVDSAGLASFGVFLNALQIDAVPEPGIASLSVGAGGLLLVRRRRTAALRA